MPKYAPSTEMLELSSQYGGVLIRDDDIPFGSIPYADPAFEFALKVLSDFDGRKNARGDLFCSDLQMIDRCDCSAFCALANGRYCIGIPMGLTQVSHAIGGVVVRALWGEGIHGLRDGLSFPFLSTPGTAVEFAEIHQRHFTEEFLPLLEAGYSLHLHFCSNIILLFVLLHMIRHATDGHATHLQALGEPVLEDSTAAMHRCSNRAVRQFLELEADANAFDTIWGNMLRGRPYFDVPELNAGDQLLATLLGVMMLLHSCSLEEERLASSPPLALGRFINLGRLLWRTTSWLPAAGKDIEAVYLAARSALDQLAGCDGRLESLKLPFSEVAFQWTKADQDGASGHPAVQRAQLEMRHLLFEPRTMRVPRWAT